uniref:DRBM domain-containing protein n=2 Tax=Lymnaea stagnalis TaxID=6523 RepID=A0A7S6WWR4_LYMST|nr:hypothetical protein [Lymnaea stagnalis]
MTVPPGKTPISYLQEYATKHAITPQYDLIANEGAVHEPTFIMRVTVGDNAVATGKGSSKKKAKHAAAQNALNILLGVTNGQEEIKEEPTVSTAPTPNKEEDVGNPIGELQEFTQKKLLKPPIYEFVTEQGPPHAREFICNIKLGKFTDKGTGRSKKTAKRMAAANMLAQLKALSQDKEAEKQLEDSDEDEEIPLGFEKSTFTGLKQSKGKAKPVNPQSALEIQRFYEKVMIAGGKQIRGQGQTLTPPTNYCQMLQEIAEVQRFEVQYFDIKDDSAMGLNQCLVQLSTAPVAVCQGTGPIMDEAHANAAHNALHYLRIMIK